MQLSVKIRHIYGNALVYPECERSKLICELLEKKTLSKKSLDILRKLGYEFNILSEPFDGIA